LLRHAARSPGNFHLISFINASLLAALSMY
jgi:hypothetical protein